MTARQALHVLVGNLSEENLPEAERVLSQLREPATEEVLAAPHTPLDLAPPDNEFDDDDFDGGLTEARASVVRGEGTSHEEIKQRWGIG